MRRKFLFWILAITFSAQFLSENLYLCLCFVFFVFCCLQRQWAWLLTSFLVFLKIFSFLFLVVEHEEISGVYEVNVCSFVTEKSRSNFVNLCGFGNQNVVVKLPVFYKPEIGEKIRINLDCEYIDSEIRSYYRIFNIYQQCTAHSFQLLVQNNYWYLFLNMISQLQDFVYKKIIHSFTYPVADLLAGLLYGFRANYDDVFKYGLNYLGLTHLIAISGYNVALFLLLIDKSLFFINRLHRMYMYPVFLLLFIILTGFQSSVVRACIMAQIQLLALSSRSFYDNLDALFVVFLGFLVWNPARVYLDLGFWLSVCSTFGIILFADSFLRFWSRFFSNEILLDALAMTSVSMFSTILISIVFFGQFNLFSILANLLVAPIVPILMFGVFYFVLSGNVLLKIILELLSRVFFLIFESCLELNLIFLEIIHDFFTFLN